MITIIDVSAWTYRHFYALPAMARADGTPVNAVHGCVSSLWKIMQANPEHILAVFDASKRSFRHDLYPEYKANRSPTPPDLGPQFPMIRKAIETFGVHCVSAENYEADDVIATYTKLATEAEHSVTIISSDKDLMQLITPPEHDGPIVEMFDPLKSQPIGPFEVQAKFGVFPSQMIDFQALMGDASDNVPGVASVGQKTAAKLLKDFGTLDAILDAAQEPHQPNMGKAVQSNLNLYSEMARLSKKLVTLKNDVDVEFDLEKLRCKLPDSSAVSEFLNKMELVTLHEEIFGQKAA